MSARNKKKKTVPIMLTVVAVVVAWAAASYLYHLPPASWIQEAFDNAPQAAGVESTTPAFPDKAPFRFSSSTLSDVCGKYGLETDLITRELAGFAITAKPDWSIKRIAEENDMEREALFEVLRELSLNR